jgi:hypothetical protein
VFFHRHPHYSVCAPPRASWASRDAWPVSPHKRFEGALPDSVKGRASPRLIRRAKFEGGIWDGAESRGRFRAVHRRCYRAGPPGPIRGAKSGRRVWGDDGSGGPRPVDRHGSIHSIQRRSHLSEAKPASRLQHRPANQFRGNPVLCGVRKRSPSGLFLRGTGLRYA